jgi:hypothetical protein
MGRSRFVLGDIPVEIALGDGDWVRIRPRLSWGDRQAIRGAGISSRFRKGAEIETTANFEAMNIGMLLCGIVEWNLTDSDGKLMPVSRESIGALDEATGDAILMKMGDLYRAITEESKNS